MPAISVRMLLILAAGLCVSALAPALADKPAIYTEALSKQAVGGYDPVAYFKEGRARLGDKTFATTWNGAEFRFASRANLDAFVADPDRYAPQYGGYCAWAVSHGYTAKGDPNAWKIVDGKLYLNFNLDVQKKWEADTSAFIKQGDANWPKVLK